MSKKKLALALSTVSLAFIFNLAAYAGTWRYDGPDAWQWTYINDDESLATPGWKLIDNKWYSFDENHYLNIGTITQDGKRYYLSVEPDTLGQLCTNTAFFTGSYDSDGVWNDNEIPADVFEKWYNYTQNYNGSRWTKTDELAWNAEFAKYNITDDLFVEYNDSTKGNSYEVIYLIPEGVDHAAYYDIGNLLTLKLFMRTDGLSDASFRYAPDYTSIIFTYSIPAEASRLAKKEAYDEYMRQN